MKPTLLVLAAGMGRRYGGLKQMDGVGPNGEIILAASQGYTKKHNALKGIESVRNNINSEIVKPVRD